MKTDEIQLDDRPFDLTKYILLALIGSAIYLLPYARVYFYDQMVGYLGFTPIQFGTVLAIYGVTSTIGTFCSGILADRYSCKWLMVISLIATAIGGIALVTQPSYYEFLGIYILWGLSITLTYNSAQYKAVRYVGSSKQQGKLFGSAIGLQFMGGGILAMLGATVFAYFSAESGEKGFTSVIWFYVLLHFIIALAVIAFWKKDKPLADDEKWRPKDAISVLKHPATWYLGFIIYFVYAMRRCLDMAAPYMGQVMGIDESANVYLASFRDLAFPLIGGVLAGILMDRSKYKIRICQCSIALSGLAFMGMYFVPVHGDIWQVVFYAALGVALTMQSGAYLTAYSLLEISNVPKKITGSIIGVSISIGYLPDISINYLSNYLVDTYGFEHGCQYVFLVAAGHAVMAVILYSLFNRYLGRLRSKNKVRAAA